MCLDFVISFLLSSCHSGFTRNLSLKKAVAEKGPAAYFLLRSFAVAMTDPCNFEKSYRFEQTFLTSSCKRMPNQQ
jgi:hypothetical protein